MINKRRKIVSLFLIVGIVTVFLGNVNLFAAEAGQQVKNVIILIPDGCNSNVATLARWFNDNKPLAVDEIASGLVRTYWAGGPVTDSAPAATALATGYKAYNKTIGIYPNENKMPGLPTVSAEATYKPVASVLEGAKLMRKATGLVTNTNIQHATPGGFSAHWNNRDEYQIIAEQQVYQDIDLVFAAGSYYLKGENRNDKEDLIRVLKERGHDFVTTPDAMRKSTANKIWGLFDEKYLSFELARDPAKEPSLAEMTAKAVSVLSKNSNGFFLMVEGGIVDSGCHNNDPVGAISEFLAFDKAVRVALDFAKEKRNTVVIVCTDHETGGMTIGSEKVKDPAMEPLEAVITPLKKGKIDAYNLSRKLNNDRSNLKELMADYWGVTDLSETEIQKIKEANAGSELWRALGQAMSRRADIGWTTGQHSGGDVPLYCYHPNPALRLTGVVENTDVAKYIANVLGFNLDQVNKRLFVSIAAFQTKGATVRLDKTDPENPVVVVTKGATTLRLPVYKDLAILNGKTIIMNGLTIYIKEKIYVPQQAIDLIN